MTKAILALDSDGVPVAPATLCADAAEEAHKLRLPIFEQVLAQLSEGMEMRANGGSQYELWDQGRLVGMLEVFEAPRVNGEEEGDGVSTPGEY
ncbi:MAG TPA: hypothetical protein VE058_02355 [Steroidobacteraceae bacterium]|nr:hypothetical protein [Steroidobacteraceae bacterium]